MLKKTSHIYGQHILNSQRWFVNVIKNTMQQAHIVILYDLGVYYPYYIIWFQTIKKKWNHIDIMHRSQDQCLFYRNSYAERLWCHQPAVRYIYIYSYALYAMQGNVLVIGDDCSSQQLFSFRIIIKITYQICIDMVRVRMCIFLVFYGFYILELISTKCFYKYTMGMRISI